MKHLGTLAVFAASLFAALLTSCTPPPGANPPPVTVGSVVSCGADAVRACMPSGVGPVNTCLSQTTGATPCLIGLIQPAGCGAESIIACLVRQSASEQNAAAQINPGDVLGKRMADNGRAYLESRGYTFAK